MNSVSQGQGKGSPPPNPAMGVDEILFTLFRHKWMVLGFTALGIIGAIAAWVLRPPPYVSEAKLMVHYVSDSRVTDPKDPDAQNRQQVGVGPDSVINGEIAILTSLDVITQVVATVGPEKILASKGGGNSPLAAAAVVAKGLDVPTPLHSSILTISFKNPDRTLAQPVLDAIIHAYMRQHWVIHQGAGELRDYFLKQKEDLTRQLAKTEEDLKQAKQDAKVFFVEDAKRSYESRITKAEDDLTAAKLELTERQAVLGSLGAEITSQATTNGPAFTQDQMNDYTEICTELDMLQKQERELLRRGYKEAHPLVQTVRGQLRDLSLKKNDLERLSPMLKHVTVVSSYGSSTNANGGDVASQLMEMKRLNARVIALGNILSNLQFEASRIEDREPKIAQLERRRTELQKNYDSVLMSLAQTEKGESTAAGNVINMSVVQNPTPPELDTKKLMKLIGMVLLGCIGAGVGLAFAIDMFLDRSIKGPGDVERHLRMPVFLSIPDTTWSSRLRLPGISRAGPVVPQSLAADTTSSSTMAIAPWDPEHHLKSYAEGLRERVRTYFEVNDLNLKKPKLVAVTGCGKGTGVSTLASGLAAELSKTGDGNVLLVDMNGEQGTAHSFFMGKPGCGITDVLQPDARADAQVQENLYVASLDKGTSAELAMVLPKRFNYLVPKLKASDYDYIIFDMPPVSPTSPTPRLASHMDITLLILESEKTKQRAAAKAKELMRESRANVAAVLNKCRQHVPQALSQEL
jgi:uncharacterized protein involved in exopolysaccharide biosynthesis/Mrp family chromosome partitioning ATPase